MVPGCRWLVSSAPDCISIGGTCSCKHSSSSTTLMVGVLWFSTYLPSHFKILPTHLMQGQRAFIFIFLLNNLIIAVFWKSGNRFLFYELFCLILIFKRLQVIYHALWQKDPRVILIFVLFIFDLLVLFLDKIGGLLRIIARMICGYQLGV